MIKNAILENVWLSQINGQMQKDNIFSMIPHEVNIYIVRQLDQALTVQHDLTQFINKQMDVFKKIYQLHYGYHARVNKNYSCKITPEMNDEACLMQIFKSMTDDHDELISRSWQLALIHYKDFNAGNVDLVEKITMWALKDMNKGIKSQFQGHSLFEPEKNALEEVRNEILANLTKRENVHALKL